MLKPANLTTHLVSTGAAANEKIQQGNGVVHVSSFNWRTVSVFYFFFSPKLVRGKDPLTESRDSYHMTCSEPGKTGRRNSAKGLVWELLKPKD